MSVSIVIDVFILFIPFTIKGTVEGRRAIHKAGR